MPRYEELEIKVPNSVYSPAEDSYLAARLLEEQLADDERDGLTVLDMGAGSGILGLSAAMDGKVSEVLFADINPAAIVTIQGNIRLNQRFLNASCACVRSDLFDGIGKDRSFDYVLFNAPYLPEAPEGGELKPALDGGPSGIEVTERFLRGAVEHLKEHGRIVIVHSSLADEEKLWASIKALGLAEVATEKEHVFFEDIFATVLKKQ